MTTAMTRLPRITIPGVDRRDACGLLGTLLEEDRTW